MDRLTIGEAKTQLPRLFRELTNLERLAVTVEHGTRRPSPRIHLMPDAVFQALLRQALPRVRPTYTCDTTAPGGWWTLDEQILGVYGDGPTLTAAVDALAEAVVRRSRAIAGDLHGGRDVPGLEVGAAVRVLESWEAGGHDGVCALCRDVIDSRVTVVGESGDTFATLADLVRQP